MRSVFPEFSTKEKELNLLGLDRYLVTLPDIVPGSPPPRANRGQLPQADREGAQRWIADGRKIGEGAGQGTGVLAYFSQGAWRCMSTDAPVLS